MTTNPTPMTADPAAVLELFERKRKQIFALLNESEPLMNALGPIKDVVKPAFDQARRAAEAKHLNLVIIGGEGHGKSTLINTLIGEDVSPCSVAEPGTVAPVYLEWANNPTPSHFVQLADHDEEICCESAEEFHSYLLQAHNPENEKKVVAGRVECNNPVLAKGVKLVDMPGVEGVSAEIAEQAREFIARSNAVLAVTRDRYYAPLIRIGGTLADDRMKPVALVSNWSSDPWLRCADEAAVGEMIKTIRSSVLEQFAGDGVNFGFGPGNVFVLNLPSVYDAKLGKTPIVKWRAHADEARRFERLFWGYLQKNGVRKVLLDARGKVEQAIGELDAKFAVRERILDELLGDSPRRREELALAFDAASEAATAEVWGQVANDGVIRSIVAKHWDEMRPAVVAVRDDMLNQIQSIAHRVESSTDRVGKLEAKAVKLEVQNVVLDGKARIDHLLQVRVNQTLEYYCGYATETLNNLFRRMPVLPDFAVSGLEITPTKVTDFVIDNMEPSFRDRLLKWGVTGTVSYLAANLAGGGGTALLVTAGAFTNPVTALVVGGAVAGMAAHFAFDYLTNNYRKSVIEGLKKSKAAVADLDLRDDDGKVRNAWRVIVEQAVANAGGLLNNRLEMLRRMVASPHERRELLEGERKGLASARESVRRLLDRATNLLD